mmetsp:Transcript_17749/g.44638  ORF Transcript_17749/g.44638 Transcript_17749/m.44638 type:complete len:262 (-) Transcript_17749:207-992(-)
MLVLRPAAFHVDGARVSRVRRDVEELHQQVDGDVRGVLRRHPHRRREEQRVGGVRARAVDHVEVEHDLGAVVAHDEGHVPRVARRLGALEEAGGHELPPLLRHLQRRAALVVRHLEEARRVGRLEEELDHVVGAAHRGEVEWRRAVGIGGVEGQAEVREERQRLRVALVRGPVEGGVLAVVEEVDVRLGADEREDEDGVVVLRGDHERRRALDVERVDVPPVREQQPHRVGVTPRARPVERLHPRSLDALVQRRALLVQPL